MVAVAGALVVLTGCTDKAASEATDPAAAAAKAAAQVSHINRTCGNGGGLAMFLTVGWSSCGAATLTNPSYFFSIGKTDYARVKPGASLAVVGDMNAPTFGYRSTGGTADAPITVFTIAKATKTPITAGVIHFDTFEPGRAATGTYEVTYPGGAASGTFVADFCPGTACIP